VDQEIHEERDAEGAHQADPGHKQRDRDEEADEAEKSEQKPRMTLRAAWDP